MSNQKFDSYDFAFEYWDRKYAGRVLLAAIRLLITGRSTLVVNMKKPRDMAMMEAAAKAAADYDRNQAQDVYIAAPPGGNGPARVLMETGRFTVPCLHETDSPFSFTIIDGKQHCLCRKCGKHYPVCITIMGGGGSGRGLGGGGNGGNYAPDA